MIGGIDIREIGRAARAAPSGVVRILTLSARGSAPREPGAAMLATPDDAFGTVGGGALEYAAIAAAREMLAAPARPWARRVLDFPLGPALGQCCGGRATLLLERFGGLEADLLDASGTQPAFARPVADGAPPDAPAPPSARAAWDAIAAGAAPDRVLHEGWAVEPTSRRAAPLFFYGAGHVGRAAVRALDGLGFAITWVDDARARFPEAIRPGVGMFVAANPADAARHAPEDAIHIVATYSHALDLEICHRVLSRPFRHLGLIGSETKRARFRARLAALGHGPGVIARMACPIGDPALGKAPAAVAIGLAAELLRLETASRASAPRLAAGPRPAEARA